MDIEKKVTDSCCTKRIWINVCILCFVNILNYSDRFTLASVLTDIQEEFNIKNDMAGLLQTSFVVVYTIAALIFGYFGDRHSRRLLLAVAVLVWNVANFACSFVDNYWGFFFIRGLFGAGQAGYSAIAPTIISDMFTGELRSMILAIFYLAIPIGQGLGYVISTQMEEATGSWTYSLRVTPAIGLVCIVLILLILEEPQRGQSDGTNHKTTSWQTDIKYLFMNPSFVYSTFGFTSVAFTAGALSWWGPKIITTGLNTLPGEKNTYRVSTIIGLITSVSGAVGLTLGFITSHKLKVRYPRIDPIICAVGLFVAAPLLIATTYAAISDAVLCYTIFFLAQIALNCNWAINVDILLNVVVPTRRSLAMGFQLFVGHSLGDAESPYLLGAFADYLISLEIEPNGATTEFRALQYSFFISCAVAVIGGILFVLNAYYIVDDIEKAKQTDEKDKN